MRIFPGLAFIIFCASVNAQKVKYKDLFPLLDAKRYEEAEPFLRQFLTQEPDNASANLQMGLVLENNTHESDIFGENEKIQVYADSAIIYFNKFSTLLDEKELRKRDEYYQEYNRRDLRTGKFEIKEQDIRYDIENRIKTLNAYKSNVKMLNRYMSDAIRQYHTAKSSFIYLSRSEKSLNDFLLASSMVTEESLDYMSQSYDSSLNSIESAKEVLEDIKIDDYLQSVDIRIIDNYKEDGFSDTDFYAESFTLWDYKEWANRINQKISAEIKPLREKLLDYSAKLNQVYTDESPDLTKLNEVGVMDFRDNLLDYDESPLPLKIFDYKKMEILYKIESNPENNVLLTELTNVDQLLQASDNNIKILKQADTLINAFGDTDRLKQEVKMYKDYVEQEFTNLESLKNFISFKKDWLEQEIPKWETMYDSLEEVARYAYLEKDTLMLEVVRDSSYFLVREEALERELITLSNTLSDSLDYFLGGLKISPDGSTCFVTKINPSRIYDWYFEEPVDLLFDEEIRDSVTVRMKSVVNRADDLWMLITLSTDTMEKGNLIRIGVEGEKLWNSTMVFSARPEDLLLDPESLDLHIILNDGSKVIFDSKGEAK